MKKLPGLFKNQLGHARSFGHLIALNDAPSVFFTTLDLSQPSTAMCLCCRVSNFNDDSSTTVSIVRYSKTNISTARFSRAGARCCKHKPARHVYVQTVLDLKRVVFFSDALARSYSNYCHDDQ